MRSYGLTKSSVGVTLGRNWILENHTLIDNVPTFKKAAYATLEETLDQNALTTKE